MPRASFGARSGAFLLATLALAAAPSLAVGQALVQVWVNPSSGVYHCPGTEHYGKTTRGEYLDEPLARSRGFRANGGRSCSTSPNSLFGTPEAPSVAVAPTEPMGTTEPCVVARVTDGDTIVCEGIGTVRLTGIDAPERKSQEPFAARATSALTAILPRGAVLTLEFDIERRDRYRRLLAYVWRGTEMINWRVVRQGFAVSYRFPPNLRYLERFVAAEAQARADSSGLWKFEGFTCLPLAGRRTLC